MLPIHHRYEKKLRHVYFSTISDYLDFAESFLGVTRYPICNFSLSLEFIFLSSFCFSLCTFKISSGKKYLLFSTISVLNNFFAQH